ncbi:MAG: hypothetical protein F4Z31_07680 [Gemmatimonadetes bacterium]|nr:hypothetical protein [Gemmatimonadota bacterium]MYJ10058.1 hypothetical protein [Gemmatimonadota bacterium]
MTERRKPSIMESPEHVRLYRFAKSIDFGIRWTFFMLRCDRHEEAQKIVDEMVANCAAITEADDRRFGDAPCIECGMDREHLVQEIRSHIAGDRLFTCTWCGTTHSQSGCCCDPCMEAEVS